MLARQFIAGCILLGASATADAAWPAIAFEVAIEPTAGFRLEAPRAALDPAGHVVVAAREVSGTRSCMFVAKLSRASGATLWRKSVCDLDSEAQAVAVDSEGDIVVGGAAISFGQSNARLMKFDGADGRVHWERILDLGASGEESVAAIAIDAQREIYVAVTSTLPAGRLVKYSAGGTLRWQSEVVQTLSGVRLDGSGTPFVIGTIPLGGGRQWAVTRFAAGSGTVVWRQWTGVAGSQPRALAIDAAGDVYVTGTTPDAEGIGLLTIKYAGTTGSEQWQKTLATADGDAGLAIAIDPRGEVVVAGHSGLARETLNLRAVDGLLNWRDSSAPRGGRAGEASSIAFDPSGNVIVGGDERLAGSGDAIIRTTALALQTGTQLWSVPLEGPNGSLDLAGTVLASAEAVFMVGENASTGQVLLARYGFAAVAAFNVQGLWWRAPAHSQSGWGMNIVHQGDLLFATWFTYDQQRGPLWLVMSEGVRTGPNAYAGTMYRVTGPPFDSAAWDPAQVKATAMGTASFTFTAADSGTFRFMDATAGVQLTHPITPQVFASPVPTCTFGGEPSSTNFQDLWWKAPAGSESGWGLNIAHQGDVLFATWFTYGANGQPLWLVASEMRKTAEGVYGGALYRTSGPFYGAQPWDPASVTVTPVGNATLTFGGNNAATFAYTVEGVAGSKAITRQVFAEPASVCR